jgi:hypothetical protein
MTDRPYIAPFDSTQPISIIPMPNGGYLVEQGTFDRQGFRPQPLGAFGSARDMIAALSAALIQSE